MKVKVKVKNTPNTRVEYILHEELCSTQEDLAAAHQEIETLFQENKDLRVSEGHLQDEIKNLKSRLATACAERDNYKASFDQMSVWWQEAIKKKREAEQETAATALELKDREERIFILEQRIEALEQENAKYRATVTFAKLNAAQEEAARLQDEVARLTNERDTTIKENSGLIFQINALDDELTAAVNLKNEYAEQVDELRKQLDTVSNLATSSFWNFLIEIGIVKTSEEIRGKTNGE